MRVWNGGGGSVWNCAISVCCALRAVLAAPAITFVSLRSFAYALLVSAGGPGGRNSAALVSTGAYAQWLDSWHTNKLWRGKTPDLWPETRELLRKYDPILHVAKMYPTAVLMVSGAAVALMKDLPEECSL